MDKKKSKKLNRLSKLAKRPFVRRKKDAAQRYSDAVQSLPRITNDTVAAHREEVLSSARKYIYPLKHSKHRIVIVSVSLFATAVLGLFVYIVLALYRFQTNSSLLYGVTQVIPFPIAKAGPDYVAYENYLFELRHYIHYYSTQQGVDFNTTSGQRQLTSFKKQALQDVINAAYTKELAAKYHVSVTNQDVNTEVSLIRQQDGLSNNQGEFNSVLSEFWGWSLSDLKFQLKQQLLAQKVVSTLDTATHARAQAALTALKGGADFSSVAAQYSDDASTKNNVGHFGFTINHNSQNVSPQTLNTLLSLKPGEISGIVNIGNALEIDKVISVNNGNIQAAHILFNFNNISTYLNPFEKQYKTHTYISIK